MKVAAATMDRRSASAAVQGRMVISLMIAF
jgi:hypothetical protein